MSMTDKSIREAFTNLRDSSQMQPLLDAARCRSESDWLIGINGTRAVTIKTKQGEQSASFHRWSCADPHLIPGN
jgi:DNA topoisomerase-3